MGGLGLLVGREAVGDADVAVVEAIDPGHHGPEAGAMGRGVAEAVVDDVVVDHLMDDGVLEFGLGEVDARIDTQYEVLAAVGAPERADAGIGQFAEEAPGIAEPDGNLG